MNGTMPKKCPACGQDMRVCVLRCPACRTEVQGEYVLERFSRLDARQLDFLQTFIRCRGSLKDLGTELGISYPTARNRLDLLIETLGFEKRDARPHRLDVLERLKRGEITAQEALERLQGGLDNE